MMDSSSEEWRMICEARYVIGLPGLMARRAYLELIQTKRGLEARKALEAVIKVEWNKKKQSD